MTYLVKRLELAVRAHLDHAIGEIGLTTPQYAALGALLMRPGTSSAELARMSFVSPQAMNEMVGILERKGLIRREASPLHRKKLLIFLTGYGEECLRQCETRADQVEGVLFAPLSTEERETLAQLLRKCADTYAADGVAPVSQD
ncbi:MarR family winged helix-turn-helix transcriptional regulator [Streptomyces shenzhenensis]|uniref:MarR family winged helix-turn-helix transcriptional regulator n=1 Tax=Streptomyces shenzhenensis TaxID=943815 RepID=UPI0015F07B1E|nr:MarR family transcriptional regulator [Streptomyces shenzhenensis]